MRVASPRPAAQLTSLSLSLSLTPTLAAPSLSPFNGAATFAVSAAGSAATREQQLQLEAILASQLTLCAFTSTHTHKRTHTRTHTRLLPRTYRTLCSRIVNKNAKARINRKSGNADANAEKCLFFARLLFAVYCLLFTVFVLCCRFFCAHIYRSFVFIRFASLLALRCALNKHRISFDLKSYKFSRHSPWAGEEGGLAETRLAIRITAATAAALAAQRQQRPKAGNTIFHVIISGCPADNAANINK